MKLLLIFDITEYENSLEKAIIFYNEEQLIKILNDYKLDLNDRYIDYKIIYLPIYDDNEVHLIYN